MENRWAESSPVRDGSAGGWVLADYSGKYLWKRWVLKITNKYYLAQIRATRSESSRARKFHTWNFRSRERMVLGAKSPVTSVSPYHRYVRGAASADSSRTCSESRVFFFGNFTRKTRPCVQKILHRFGWQFQFRRAGFLASLIVGELVCRRVRLSASWCVGEFFCRRVGCRRVCCRRVGLSASCPVTNNTMVTVSSRYCKRFRNFYRITANAKLLWLRPLS